MDIIEITSIATVFLIGELIEWAIFKHSGMNWYFRFGRTANGNPIISTIKVAVGILILTIFLSPFLLTPLVNTYVNTLILQSQNPYLLLILALSFSLLWIWHHIVGKRWNTEQYGLVAICILALIGYIYSNLGISTAFNSPAPSPSTSLTVYGKLENIGNGTNITQIIFRNKDTPSLATLKGNTYTISLPNENASYNISADWQGKYPWQRGIVYAKSLSTHNINTSNSIALQYNLTLNAPASFIDVVGTASTNTFPLAWASSINYTPSNQSTQPILTKVNYGGYNLNLPNFVSYKVTIGFSALSGNNCSAGTYELHINNGSSTISNVDWKC